MLTIRLQRIGRRNQPYFRVVLTDSRFSAKTGKFKDVLGSYDPKAGKVTLRVDEIKKWIAFGATTSGTVHNFLVDQKVIEAKKKNVLPKKTKTKKRKEAKV